MKAGRRPTAALRTAHLLRIDSYMDIAILAMWTASPRVDTMLGMAEASLRGGSPGGKDDELIEKLRALVSGRARVPGRCDFSVAMGRMRVAHDLLSLHIIRLSMSSQVPGEAGLPEDAPLAAVTRGALVESVHRGRLVICDPDGKVLEAVGDPEAYIYARSSAKPFQALPLVHSGAADALG